MKNKNIFKKLTGLEAKQKVAYCRQQDSRLWEMDFHILPADAEAPNIEDEKKKSNYLIIIGIMALAFILLSSKIFSLQIIYGAKTLNYQITIEFEKLCLELQEELFTMITGIHS